MKIKELYIYGYGKLTDFHFPSLNTFQVIYGENEAGKSTIMSFIHGILFGFPTKQQTELRYEPKNSAKYGGKLVIETKEHGIVTVERIKGKAIGDVTVILENGTVGSDELLTEILNGLDKRMYQAIFSFNVHGIQGIGRMKGEDISQYLLAAGTIGTDTMMNAEQQLQKELDTLFKPNGRKPELNQMLVNLREQDLDLKKDKKQNDSYNLLQQQSWNLQQEMEEIKVQMHSYQQNIQLLNQLIQEWPLFQEREQINKRLQEIGEVTFPIDGLSRLEHLEDQLRSVTSYVTTILERKDMLENQLEAVVPDTRIIENESIIQLVVEQWPQAQEWQEQLQGLKYEIDNIDEQIKRLMQNLHYSDENITQLSQINLGIGMKENVRKATKDYFNLRSREKEIRKQADTEKKNLIEIESKIGKIEGKLIPEDEFRILSDNQKQFKRIQQVQLEYQHIKEQIQTMKLAKGYQQTNTGNIRLFVLILLLACLTIYSFLSKQSFIAFGSLLGIIFLLVSYLLEKGKKRGPISELSSLFEREKNLSKQLGDLQKNPDKSEQYAEQINLRQEWKELILHLEMQQNRVDSINETLQHWTLEWKENDERLKRIKNELHLQVDFSPEQLPEAYELLNELLKVLQNKEAKVQKSSLLKGKYEEWASKVEAVTRTENEYPFTIQDSIIRLKSDWNKAIENQNQSKELMIKLEELKQDEWKWSNEKAALINAITELLQDGKSESKDDFRKKAMEYEEVQELLSNLVIIEKKFNHKVFDHADNIRSLDELENERQEFMNILQTYSGKLETLHKEIAQVNYEINVLEEGGTYTEKLHEFYHMRDMFNEKARQWTKVAIAKQILKMTMDRLKNDRFPKVMENAEQYLRLLTNDEYIYLHLLEDGKFVVERKDRITFAPTELSQATAEQLYVALRFALVQVLKQDYPFPVIIDDSFVNFDKKRTKKVLKLLKEMSKTTQVLFFTCHQHLLQEFSEETVLDLMANKRPQKVEVIG